MKVSKKELKEYRDSVMFNDGSGLYKSNYNVGRNGDGLSKKKVREIEKFRSENKEQTLDFWDGIDYRDEDWRLKNDYNVYYIKVFRRWCYVGCIDADFVRGYDWYKIEEGRRDLIEVFEGFRGCMNWNGEINKKKVIEEFDGFMKFRSKIWRDCWDDRYKDGGL